MMQHESHHDREGIPGDAAMTGAARGNGHEEVERRWAEYVERLLQTHGRSMRHAADELEE